MLQSDAFKSILAINALMLLLKQWNDVAGSNKHVKTMKCQMMIAVLRFLVQISTENLISFQSMKYSWQN